MGKRKGPFILDESIRANSHWTKVLGPVHTGQKCYGQFTLDKSVRANSHWTKALGPVHTGGKR